MTDKKASRSNRIPISFPDSEEESEISNRPHSDDFEEEQDAALEDSEIDLPPVGEEATEAEFAQFEPRSVRA